MKKATAVKVGALILALALGLVLVSCPTSSGGGTGDPGSYIPPSGGNNGPSGTWTGNIDGDSATAVVTGSSWTLSVPSANFSDYGTYTETSTNTASLYSTKYKLNTGTATLIDSNTVRVNLNSSSIFPGTHTLTRQ